MKTRSKRTWWIFTTKKKFCFYCLRLFTLSELYVTFINRYWKEFSNWSSMILVKSSRYVWNVFKMLVKTSQNSNRVIFNDFSIIEKKNYQWSEFLCFLKLKHFEISNLISNWFFQQFLHENQWWISAQWWRRRLIQYVRSDEITFWIEIFRQFCMIFDAFCFFD
jgi:hypothetical protein